MIRLLVYEFLPADFLVSHFKVNDRSSDGQGTDGTEHQPLLLVVALFAQGLSRATATTTTRAPSATVFRVGRTEHAKAPVIVLGLWRRLILGLGGRATAVVALRWGRCIRLAVSITTGRRFIFGLEILFESFGQFLTQDPPVSEQFVN